MVDELNKSTTFSDDRRTGYISLCGLDLQNNAKMFLIKYYVQDQIWAMLVGEVGPRFNILVVQHSKGPREPLNRPSALYT